MITLQDIARSAHEANRAYCASIGDNSQVSWDDAPNWQKNSAILGVKHLIAHPDSTPADMHESWWQAKILDGWRYGPVKDETAKTHPACIPYLNLPPEQQSKDYIFSAVVKSMLRINVDRLFAWFVRPTEVYVSFRVNNDRTWLDSFKLELSPVGRGHLAFQRSGDYHKIVPAGTTIKLMTQTTDGIDPNDPTDHYEEDTLWTIEGIKTTSGIKLWESFSD